MAAYCLFTVSAGIICDRIYERTGSIWASTLFRGALNSAAAIPLMMCTSAGTAERLFGPVPEGLISGIPLLAAALFIILRTGRGKRGDETSPPVSGEEETCPGEDSLS